MAIWLLVDIKPRLANDPFGSWDDEIAEGKLNLVNRICWLPAAPEEGWFSMDRYWRELSRLAAIYPLESASLECVFQRDPPVDSRRQNRLRRAWRKYSWYPSRVRRFDGVSVAHLLDHSYAHVLKDLPKGVKIVANVFDLAPLRDPASLRPHQVRRFRRGMRELLRADRVMAVSNQTANDLVSYLGIDPARIRVNYLGTDAAKFRRPIDRAKILGERPRRDKAIVLSVGNTQPRKNLGSLVPIFEMLRADPSVRDWQFVRAGEPLPGPLRERLVQVLGPDNLTEFSHCSEEVLVGLLQAAAVFVFPSTLEGFTFTIPEAMAAGAPVVANRTSTNPEVGGTAAAYYENGDHVAAARVIARVLSDRAYASQLRAAGFARVKELSWENHWVRLCTVYQELLK